MLAPKKVKFRKMQKGRMRGKAYRGGQITLGEFGLKALEPGWVTSRSVLRRALRRSRRFARNRGASTSC